MKIKAIITGASGMVGKSVLLECLDHPEVESVLVINRRTIDVSHPKLKELIHKDFTDLSDIKEELNDYNACFFCMGVSSIGMSEEEFSKITYNTVAQFVEVLHKLNPNMVFNYVSGAGTDSTEKGSAMWARVKGRTENKILNQGFKDAYAFRAGAIIPERGIKSNTGWYNMLYVILTPFFPLLKRMDSITTSSKLGQAMINTVLIGSELKHLENTDINRLSAQKKSL